MTLPASFQFNQGNLQDYIDCQRRFQLRHVLHQAWPAVEAEPILENEQIMEQGAKFHKIARQLLTGIPESQIESSLGNDIVMHTWWDNYTLSLKEGNLRHINNIDCKHFEEMTLATSISKFRLVAKYDLLVIHPDGKMIIFDWKTSRVHSKRKWLSDRLQTRVYPYVLFQSANALLGTIFTNPSRIEMIYWFTEFPDQPESFSYDLNSYEVDAGYFKNIITAIDQKTEPLFPLTPVVQRCLFCNYRSLCNRGKKPGELHQLEEWQQVIEDDLEDVSIDYDQIGEIEF